MNSRSTYPESANSDSTLHRLGTNLIHGQTLSFRQQPPKWHRGGQTIEAGNLRGAENQGPWIHTT